MDNNDRRRRQNPSGYANQQGTLNPILQPQAPYPVETASDRFRQAPLTSSTLPPASGASGSRTGPHNYGYTYDQASHFGGSALQPPYPAQDYASDQQPHRGSQYYSQHALYSMPGQPSTATQSAYEQVQPYQQNRDPAIEALGAGYGAVAQGHQGQYYAPPGHEGPTNAPATAMATQSVPSQYPPLGYTAQQAPVGRGSLAPTYSAAGMTDPQPATSQGAYPQASYGESSSNEQDDLYKNYRTDIKKTLEYTKDGRLGEAGDQLMRLSGWLLRSVEPLGLARDDADQYEQRLALWEEFNDCWLVTLQKQKDMTQAVVNTGQRPHPPQNLLDLKGLAQMGDQLTKHCDNLEKHGLVDYQMGVAEEEIVAMLMTCEELLGEAGLESGPSQQASAATGSRRKR